VRQDRLTNTCLLTICVNQVVEELKAVGIKFSLYDRELYSLFCSRNYMYSTNDIEVPYRGCLILFLTQKSYIMGTSAYSSCSLAFV